MVWTCVNMWLCVVVYFCLPCKNKGGRPADHSEKLIGPIAAPGGPKVVYDFEDPHVARSFLAPEKASELWAWLPLELAVDTLWSAGPRGGLQLGWNPT